MSGGNSYVFEISGGNSHTIQQVPSRKRMEIRHSFSNERKPPVIQNDKTEERMEIRQSFGANGKINACRSAIRSQTKKPPVVEKHAGFRPPTHGGQLPMAPEKTHGAALAITKRTNTCQPLAIGQSAGCIAAARHRSKWRAAA